MDAYDKIREVAENAAKIVPGVTVPALTPIERAMVVTFLNELSVRDRKIKDLEARLSRLDGAGSGRAYEGAANG